MVNFNLPLLVAVDNLMANWKFTPEIVLKMLSCLPYQTKKLVDTIVDF